ncbi:MAG TPA: hypothetical protein VMU81_27260 [Acetobacteraceae bacterium]|nr:hypothetical protein [Acetobacteraceae bacterium]
MSATQQASIGNALPFGQADAAFRQFWDQGETIMHSLNQWNAEFARFVGERMSRNAQAFGRMAECCRMSDVLDAEAQWVHDAFEDYARESSHLIEANQKLVAAWIGGGTAENGETVKAEPAKAPAAVGV